ncbi:MAG: UDP-N-acetylmuramoyl-L-alanyl-D-glutamate--2,6-diaminopimelate ligase [Planctomycetes bacterium]|nr:UDP-N-acetylmuramoyl-L-alanyl-D-glutamate--2,6-diaminopimelate ligase [Planctomycetota bacterium]
MTELAYPSGLRPREGAMQLQELRAILAPEATYRFRDAEVTGLAFDSREVRPGYAFFAVPGTLDDGARYVDDALARGAAVVVSERAMNIRVPVFVVGDARQALARAAGAFYEHPSLALDVIGVTGTNGKTTTAHLLRHLLRVDGRRVGLLGTIHYEFDGRQIPAHHTTPDAVCLQGYLREMVDRGLDACVMEASSHALVQERTFGTRWRAGVFLNLTQDHLDYHGTMRRYAAAKARLFQALAPGSVAVLNVDSPVAELMAEALTPGVHVVTFGRDRREATLHASRIRSTLDGTAFTLRTPRGTVDLRLPLPGMHNVENALAAAATAHALGVSELTIAHALETAQPVRGRMELAGRDDRVRVFVDYAHTPDALAKACSTLRELTTGPLTVVFGCGGDRDRGKRPRMARAVARFADRVVITSDNPRSEDPDAILDEVEAGFVDLPSGVPLREIVRCSDRGQAILRAVRDSAAGGVVLIAGKGHETYQILGDSVVPFDDRVYVREALAAALQGADA